MRGTGGPDPVVANLAYLGTNSILEEAKERFRACSEWESNYRKKFIEDIKFATADSFNGYQWPDDIRHTRDLNDRPCLTLNVVRQHNLQIENEARRNKASARILGMGNGATQESANVVKAIIRHIEYVSKAQRNAYTPARHFQVAGGIGWWRIVTDYESNDSFDQEIFIQGIPDPLSVYMDPDCQRIDCSDGRYAFVFSFLPRDLIMSLIPSYEWEMAAPRMPIGIAPGESFFIEKDHWMVCEYFRKVPRVDNLISFIDRGERRTIRASQMPSEAREELLNDSLTLNRKVVDQVVEWKLIVGDMIVDETMWPGKHIPLIRVIGEEDIIGGVLDRKGHTRAMHDAQRMYNYNARLYILEPVPTPDGWTTVGDLEDGDWVFGADGKPIQVKEALPVYYDEECFKITFDNGYSVVTDAGHIWRVEERGKRISAGFTWEDTTVATVELKPRKHFVILPAPLALTDSNLRVDPYLLGLWLGDGYRGTGVIDCEPQDGEEEAKIIEDLGYRVGFFTNELRVEGITEGLKSIGVFGYKHIPIKYLRGSFEQRLSLLQGLMDADGHFHEKVNQCIFVKSDANVISGILELCASLGIKAYLTAGASAHVESRVSFTAPPNLPVFRLNRKASSQIKERERHWRRYRRVGIKSVEPIESVPVRCITLDTPNHLFLVTKGMIPTHNSAQVEFGALQAKTPWLAPAAAIEGLESIWNTANTENHAVLPWKHVDDDNPDVQIPPPQRTEPPTTSPVYTEGMQTAFMQMMMTSGQWANQQGQMGNERTGSAIQERLQQGETSTYHFQDNYEDALVYTYQQIIDLIPKVYDTRRVKHILADDGTEMEVDIDPRAAQTYMQEMDRQNTVIRRVFNPTLGKYDVAAEIGPNLITKRKEAVDALTMILTEAPALTGIIGDILLRNMEFDDAQEASLRLKRMVPPQALGQGPTPTEQQQQQAIAGLQNALQQSLQKQAKDSLRLAGKDQMRDIDVYKAETDRIKALADVMPVSDPEGLQKLIEQLVEDALETNLMPIIKANLEGTGEQSGVEGAEARTESERPPVPGAMRAGDGEWYMMDPTRQGRYLRLGPLAQQRTPPGTR